MIGSPAYLAEAIHVIAECSASGYVTRGPTIRRAYVQNKEKNSDAQASIMCEMPWSFGPV
jgi:hypothetical protein